MTEHCNSYFDVLQNIFANGIKAKEDDNERPLNDLLDKVVTLIIDRSKKGAKVFLIGNGASASIASHVAVDFSKNAGVKALSFSDPSLLTCFSNDYSYEQVFEKAIEIYAEPKDILIAISSSGKSENILRAFDKAREKDLKVVTLSGFDPNSPLRMAGDINFFVQASDYGIVEVAHTAICHYFVDMCIRRKNKES